MKMLTVSLLVCALMALAATQDDVVEPSPTPEATAAPDGSAVPAVLDATDDGNSTEAPALEWFPFQGRLHGFVATPMTWVAAEKHCQTMDAHLASVRSIDEHQYLLQFIYQNDNKEAWIGGSDCQEVNQWLWTDGSVVDDNNNRFCEGLRHPHPCTSCVQMSYDNRCWDIIECYQTRTFVCVKPNPSCPGEHCPVEVPSDQ